MLWYKGWRETRIKLLFSFGFLIFLAVFTYSVRNSVPPSGAKPVAGIGLMGLSFMTVLYTLLAGAGINTQPALQAVKGLHGSTLFTLSLPVSRLQLLAVRASLGWIEMSAVLGMFCGGMWLASPYLRTMATPKDMLRYALTLIMCGSSFYFLSVVLATFLDEVWRVWGTMAAFGGFWLISYYLPSPVNIIGALRDRSPLIAHTMPWNTMAFSMVMAAALFLLALKIARAREY